jgi:hypothetical protein
MRVTTGQDSYSDSPSVLHRTVIQKCVGLSRRVLPGQQESQKSPHVVFPVMRSQATRANTARLTHR